MTTFTGYVEEIRDGKRLKMDDGNWYSAFASTQCSGVAAGDYVTFSFQVSLPKDGKTYNNIKGNVKKASAPATSAPPKSAAPASSGAGYAGKVFPVPALHGDRSIIRQNSLGNAVKLVDVWLRDCGSIPAMEMMKLAEMTVELARYFESYSAGDMDAAIAEAAVREMIAKEHS